MGTKIEATLEDLYRVPEHGKAELINGKIVMMSPTGGLPGYAGGKVFASLLEYSQRTKRGHAIPDNVGFIVDLPHRKSFSPDAAFYIGELTMKFLEGAPVFAFEVRSESDYGSKAEQEIVDKRTDYFAAGTLVMWDVDLLSEDMVKVYRAKEPENSIVYRRGELAEAEPAMPGWTMPVDELFPDRS